MSSKITFSLWDKENNVLYTGGAVRIFEGADCTGTKVASTEAGEIIGDVVEIFETSGLYYVTGLDTAVYSMSLNAQPLVNLTNIILVGIDLVTHLANADIHSELDDTETSSDTKIWSINQIKAKIAEISGYAPDDISIQLNVDDELEVKAINGSIITDASIPAAKLAIDSVETAKIKDANITVAKINYDTDDFEADGTSLSIKQNFSSEEILNEGKSLNENLGRLQSRLKELEGSIGGLKRRIIYSDYERATNTINNEASAIREYNSDDDTWKAIVRFPFWKHSGDTTIVLKCEMKTPTGNEVLVKLEGNSSSLDSTSTPAAAYTTKELSANISSYTDDSINDMVVSFKAITNTGYIKNIIVEVIGSE